MSSAKITKGRTHVYLQAAFPLLKQRVEHEALVVGLKATKRLGIRRLKVFGDFELVIK